MNISTISNLSHEADLSVIVQPIYHMVYPLVIEHSLLKIINDHRQTMVTNIYENNCPQLWMEEILYRSVDGLSDDG